MDKTYNGRQLKSALINGFKALPAQELSMIKDDLGLSMPIEYLLEYQKKLVRPGGSVSTDELYMTDCFADVYSAFFQNYSFAEISTSNEDMRFALSDIMAKRGALGDLLPIDHSSLVNTYSKYLISTGYDDESIRPKPEYELIEKLPSGIQDTQLSHPCSTFFGCEESNALLARTDAPYRFNTEKKRVYPIVNDSQYHLLLVRLNNEPLAFESLAEIINGNAHLSKDIIYCAPVGRSGLLTTLIDTAHGYIINLDTVSALAGRELVPFELNLIDNCAAVIVPAEVSQSIALSILDFGYSVRFVGHTTKAVNSISVFYKGLYHTLDANIVRSLLPGYTSCVTLSDTQTDSSYIKSIFPSENIFLSVFGNTSFDVLYKEISDGICELERRFPDCRIYAYLSMPTVITPACSNHNTTIAELLAIYKALAEKAIPVVKSVFTPYQSPQNASLFLVCDSK